MHALIVYLQIFFSKLIKFTTVAVIYLIAFRAFRVNFFNNDFFDSVSIRNNIFVDDVFTRNDVFVDDVFIRNDVFVDDVFTRNNIFVDDVFTRNNIFVDDVFTRNNIFVYDVFVDNNIFVDDAFIEDVARLFSTRFSWRNKRREEIFQLIVKQHIYDLRLRVRKLRKFHRFVFSFKK